MSVLDSQEHNLTANLQELKKFNQQRKVFAATKAMEAASIFADLMGRSISGIIESEDPKMIEKFQDAMDYGGKCV